MLQRIKKLFTKEKLYTKNRLIILNENSFEEVFSLRLTLMNVFVVGTLGAIIIIIITTFLIAFTTLRELIPGYTSSELKNQATQLAIKSDSLNTALKQNQIYLESIKKYLKGDLEYAKVNKDSILAKPIESATNVEMNATEKELEFRKKVAEEEKKSKTKK